jgi:ribosomal protein S12 methylthiotransferase
LLIISQDTSAYGVDIRYQTGFFQGRPIKSRLYELVEALAELAEHKGDTAQALACWKLSAKV